MLRLLALRTAIFCARPLYGLMKLLPLRNRVTFMSRQSNLPSRDFRMLAEELESRDGAIETVMLCRELDPGPLGRVRYVGTVLVQMYHLARSRVCVIDGYVIPVSVFSHRQELTVVQMWHALGAIKKFGYQSLDAPGGRCSAIAETMRMHASYDIVLCGGPGAIPFFASAFGVDPSRVLPLGLPRIDYLLERKEQSESGVHPDALLDLISHHPRLTDESRIKVLYAPTFRRDEATKLRGIIDRFDPGRHTLLVKPHCLERAAVDSAEHLVDATGIGVLDLLPLCDVVITDYSAVAFEAYALDKPVYYYVYDIEEYERGCGLNINPLLDLAANSSTEMADIVGWIDSGTYDTSAGRRIAEEYLPTPLEGSTARIAELVLERMGRGGRR